MFSRCQGRANCLLGPDFFIAIQKADVEPSFSTKIDSSLVMKLS
jgi:hypothetical protein